MTSLGSLLLLSGIGIACFLSGRLFVGAIGLDPLRRLEPASACASAIAGTAVWTLGFGWLSAARLPAPRIAVILTVLHLALLGACLLRGRLDVLLPRGTPASWGWVLGAGAVTALVALLPVLRTNGFASGNDTYTYCAFSEWLQEHGFGTPCLWDARSPVTYIPWLYQQEGYPLGMAYLVALVQAASRAASALLVYPAVSAWGLVLEAWALFVAARWVLGLSHARAGVAALVFAVVPHPLYWGHHNGSLQQTHALPALLLAATLLARAVRENLWRPPMAALLALLSAFLVSVYLPVVPLLVAAAVPWGWLCLRRIRRRRLGERWLVFVGTASLLLPVLAFGNLHGVATRFGRFVSSAVGEHVPFSLAEFLGFAMGTQVLGLHGSRVEVPLLSAAWRGLTPVGLVLFLVGLYCTARRPRTWGLAAMAFVLAAALGHYALFIRDPWTGSLGHTWSVFKLIQWAYPVVFLLQVSGLNRLQRTLGRARWFTLPLLAALPLSQLAVQWNWGDSLGRSLREVLPGERPLEEFPALRRRVQALPQGTILVVARPENRHRWLAAHVALLAYPRPILGDWTASASVVQRAEDAEAYAALVSRIGEDGVVPLLCGFTPFQPGGFEALGGGLARLVPSGAPLVVHVVNPTGLGRDAEADGPAFRMGRGRTKVVLWSPRDLPAELVLSLEPYPAAATGTRPAVETSLTQGDYDRRAVRRAVEQDRPQVTLLDGRLQLRIPLRLSRGLSTAILRTSSPVPLTVAGLEVLPTGQGATVASIPR